MPDRQGQPSEPFRLCGQPPSNGPYLIGGKFTVADAYLFTILKWKFMAHVGQRPKVKDALRAERLD